MAEHDQFVREMGPVLHKKVFGIPWGTPKLPEPSIGTELILRDRSGNYASATTPTAGEQTWGSYDTWYRVDMVPHHFERSFSDLLVTSDAGFEVRVAVTAQVVDPQVAVENQHSTFEQVLDPLIKRAVEDCSFRFYEAHPQFDSMDGNKSSEVDLHGRPSLGTRWFDSERVYSLRLTAQRYLSKELSSLVAAFPEWLNVNVDAVSVDFDQSTKAHLANIRASRRATELVAVDHQQTEAQAESKMKIRKMWRNELKGYLSDRSLRAFEEVYDDPTPERISAAVAKVDANEREQMSNLLTVVRDASDRVDIHSQEGFISMVAGLQNLQKNDGASGAEVLPSLETSSESAETDDDRDWR